MTDATPVEAVEAVARVLCSYYGQDPDTVMPGGIGQRWRINVPAARAILTAAAPHIVAGIALRIEREVYGEQGGINEPHPTIDDLIDWAARDRSEATDHAECPHYCNLCGEQLARTRCPKCYGSGWLPTPNLASLDCGKCGGAGWVHDGCAEKTYAELVAELGDLRAGIEALRDEWRAGRCACLTCAETRRHADALDALLRGAK